MYKLFESEVYDLQVQIKNTFKMIYLAREGKKLGQFMSKSDTGILVGAATGSIVAYSMLPKEKRTDLIPNHFDAVNLATTHFKKVYNTIFTTEEYDTSNLSVQERNSVLFLSSIIDLKRNFPNEISDEFEELLKTALKIIYMGVFRKFRNEIATLAARQKKKKLPLAKIILELNAVMNNYPIKQIARMDALRWENEKEQNNQFEEPKIVITETFA